MYDKVINAKTTVISAYINIDNIIDGYLFQSKTKLFCNNQYIPMLLVKDMGTYTRLFIGDLNYVIDEELFKYLRNYISYIIIFRPSSNGDFMVTEGDVEEKVYTIEELISLLERYESHSNFIIEDLTIINKLCKNRYNFLYSEELPFTKFILKLYNCRISNSVCCLYYAFIETENYYIMANSNELFVIAKTITIDKEINLPPYIKSITKVIDRAFNLIERIKYVMNIDKEVYRKMYANLKRLQLLYC